MAGNPEAFAAGHQGAGGLIKPAVEREALQGGVGAKKQRVPKPPKMVDQDSGQVTEGETIDEREIATSRKRFAQSGGQVGETRIPRVITAPTDRNATPKESLAKTQEHLGVLEAHANTHYGAIQTAAKAVPEAHSAHGAATRSLGEAHAHLALATQAFATQNSPKGNDHIKKASNALIAAHGKLNSTAVRSVTGGEVPLHIDELKAWKSHIDNLRGFRRKGKPFPYASVGKTKIRTGTPLLQEIGKASKGTILGDKIARAERGTSRTPKWERGETSRPSQGEKGTGVIDTASRGTNAGTTGEMDPRRKASNKTRVNNSLVNPSKRLGRTPTFEGAQIGDTPKDLSLLKADTAKDSKTQNRGSKGGTYKGASATTSPSKEVQERIPDTTKAIPSSKDTEPGPYGKRRIAAANAVALKPKKKK